VTTRILLDTDIGTNVDDTLALALILRSPDLRLEGVTCVSGDVRLRARVARALLHLAGRDDVPVVCGAAQSLLGHHPVRWEGHEGAGLLGPTGAVSESFGEHAAAFIARMALTYPGELHLVAIGPLTNVALALRLAPELATSLAGMTIMGGAARVPPMLDRPPYEHNIRSDPEAAQIVFTSGAPITLVPLDVTLQTRIDPAGVSHIRTGGSPLQVAVADHVAQYPRFRRLGYTYLHDPLAIALLLCPALAEFQGLHVAVECCGEHTTGMTVVQIPVGSAAANARVALGVDVPGAEAFIIERLAGQEAV
jgi:purine nucleosidase